MTPPDKVSEALKACPFCGGKARRYTLDNPDDHANEGGDVIDCENCYASTKVFFGEKDGLIEAWNTRAATTPAAVVISVKEITEILMQPKALIDILAILRHKYPHGIIITPDNEKDKS